MSDKIRFLNILIDNLDMASALAAVDRLIEKRDPQYLVTLNIDHVVRLHKDVRFKEAYDSAAVILADGMPILWAARFLGTPLKEKVSGSDLFPKLCEISAHKGYKIFFMGGREGAAQRAAEIFRVKYPGIRIVGVYSPPFGFEADSSENYKIVSMIRGSGADIVFVGLGAPKQENWIYEHREEYRVPVSIGIGASFEFAAGFVKRAPLWMQRTGFEWLWRLAMEPKRLWRRYLVEDMEFFRIVLKQKFKKSKIV